jgi:hypothetical protein
VPQVQLWGWARWAQEALVQVSGGRTHAQCMSHVTSCHRSCKNWKLLISKHRYCQFSSSQGPSHCHDW